jgi:hypothetical protein
VTTASIERQPLGFAIDPVGRSKRQSEASSEVNNCDASLDVPVCGQNEVATEEDVVAATTSFRWIQLGHVIAFGMRTEHGRALAHSAGPSAERWRFLR